MTSRRCANCGAPEERTQDKLGREKTNINPLTGLCLDCTVAAATARHTFHSRRAATAGEVRDARMLAAGKDEE